MTKNIEQIYKSLVFVYTKFDSDDDEKYFM
jgi:hypothetical protein